MTDATVALLAELAVGAPSLPLAACRGRSDLFDREDDDGIAQAVAICGRCGDREPCARWASRQDPFTLNGVIAGRHYRPDHKKKGTP